MSENIKMERPTEDWIYTGFRVKNEYSQNPSLYTSWLNPEGTAMYYPHKRSEGVRTIGGVYRIRLGERPGSAYIAPGAGGPQYLHMSDATDEQLAEWNAKSSATQVVARSKSNEKKDAKLSDEAYLEILAPIKKAYRQANTATEAEAIIAKVIRTITRG
jgi:hypothetical protein